MKTINKQKIVRYYYTIWAGDGYNATDKQYFSAEYAINDAIKYAMKHKTKVWVELISIDATQNVTGYEIIFKLYYNTIARSDEKVKSTLDYKFVWEK